MSAPVEIVTHRGASAPPDAPPDLVIEVPHGATRTAHYRATRASLRAPGPEDLVDFFHVNTDAGAPELAQAVAAGLVARAPERVVQVLVATLPRTFVDVNRVIDVDPAAFREGRVTPGVPPWITDPEDLVALRAAHAAYVEVATRAIDAAGRALLLHTYAPRSVDVEVDVHVAAALRRAWSPEVAPSWPLRPEVDVIGRALDGAPLVDPDLLARLRAAFAAVGIEVADGQTYPLHPSTQAWHHTQRHPGRILCLEVRRDLLADPWDPFVQMHIGAAGLARVGGPLVDVLHGWLGGRGR